MAAPEQPESRSGTAGGASTVELRTAMGCAGWTQRQKWLAAIVSLAIIVDGFDNQVIGLTIPALMADWHVARAAFAPVLAFGIVGLSIGTLIAGWFGDRHGRKRLLVISLLLFGGMTAVTTTVHSIEQLMLMRVLTGLGIGGAVPNATSLLAEFTPLRRQMLAVTMGIACIPIGGVVAGYLAAFVIPHLGWRFMYGFGGLAPILVALLVMLQLPESPHFLALDASLWPRLARELNRMLGRSIYSDDTRFAPDANETHAPLRAILQSRYRRDTLALWSAYFCNLLCVFIFFNWLPSLLASLHRPPSAIGLGPAIFNLSGVVAGFVGVQLIGLIGSRRVMVIWCTGAILGGIAFAVFDAPQRVFFLLAFEGCFIIGGQNLLYAIAAHIYPAPVRATGIGSAVAVGRLGAIASTYLGSALLLFDATGRALFIFVAVTMSVTLLSILFVSSTTRPEPAPMRSDCV